PASGCADGSRGSVTGGPGRAVAVSAGGERHDYEVLVGRGLLAELPRLLAERVSAHRWVVISDDTVGALYGRELVGAMKRAALDAALLTVPAGERHKPRESWAELTDQLLAAGCGRDTAIVALGGGVSGDLAGFVAATFLRGVPVVQVPTSLVAMIDSAVGGKTGVDTRTGKNLIGSFHQPRRVIADTATLATLPPQEVRSGLAEAIKHGAIADAAYFEETEAVGRAILALDADALARLVARSVEIKAAVVGADEREAGLRKILNFGHTIGHAVEAASRFALLHGEAIAIGMVVEAVIGEAIGTTEPGTARTLERVLGRFGLPTTIPSGLAREGILELTRLDKKARRGKVEYALLERIGAVSPGTGSYGVAVEDEVVLAALSSRTE
ncbi:MAG TPA: 3-dehydroquinate synthase, partial [Longimicrobiaceae bacterium]|nr:3-dehydroquinate synthase [Longimicrobiaceae bacterium]